MNPEQKTAQGPATTKNSIDYKRLTMNPLDQLAAIIEQLEQLEEFSSEQISSATSGRHRFNSIKGLVTYTKDLIKLGYKKEEIISIANHNGGGQNLKTVYDLHNKLTMKGYSIAQIVEIASHDGGSANLKTVVTKDEALSEYFDKSQITKMVNRIGGSIILTAVLAQYADLSQKGFLHIDIVSMATHTGAATTLELVNKHYKALIRKCETNSRIVKEASRTRAYISSDILRLIATSQKPMQMHNDPVKRKKKIARMKSLVKRLRTKTHPAKIKIPFNRTLNRIKFEAKLKKFNIRRDWDSFEPQLKNRGFNESMIQEIILRKSPAFSCKLIVQHTELLLSRGYSHKDITRIGKHKGGKKNLETVVEHHDELILKGFDTRQIVIMVSLDGGHLILKTVVNNSVELFKTFNAWQIFSIAKQRGSLNLATVVWTTPMLLNRNFTAENITFIASHTNSHKNLCAVIKNLDVLLIEMKLTAEEISLCAGKKYGDIAVNEMVKEYNKAKEMLRNTAENRDKKRKKTDSGDLPPTKKLRTEGSNPDSLQQSTFSPDKDKHPDSTPSDLLQGSSETNIHNKKTILKFTQDQLNEIINFSNEQTGMETLTVIIKYHAQDKLSFLTAEEIVNIVTKDSGLDVFKAVVDGYQGLRKGSDNETIVQAALKPDAMTILPTMTSKIRNRETTKALLMRQKDKIESPSQPAGPSQPRINKQHALFSAPTTSLSVQGSKPPSSLLPYPSAKSA